MKEIYRNIPNYEDLYQVSNFGNIKSLPKGDGNGNRERILKQEVVPKNHTSYRRVTLSKEGEVKRFQVHRLVAEAFVPGFTSALHVNHIDNNGENNYASNLEMVTHSENMKHAQKQGRLFDAQSKGQKAGAEAKRVKAEKDLIDNYYNRTYDYLRSINEFSLKESATTGHKRILLHLTCIRCNSGEVVTKERYELNNSKRTLQCRACANKFKTKKET